MKKLSVDVWSDVMCPWCAVGWTQFAKAMREVEAEIEVDARFMPFELNPDLPAPVAAKNSFSPEMRTSQSGSSSAMSSHRADGARCAA